MILYNICPGIFNLINRNKEKKYIFRSIAILHISCNYSSFYFSFSNRSFNQSYRRSQGFNWRWMFLNSFKSNDMFFHPQIPQRGYPHVAECCANQWVWIPLLPRIFRIIKGIREKENAVFLWYSLWNNVWVRKNWSQWRHNASKFGFGRNV